MTTQSYGDAVAQAVSRVFEANRDFPDHRSQIPWLHGYLGDPNACVWFIAWYPSAKMVGRANQRGNDPELQWSESVGDKLFRKMLVKHGFKSGEPLQPGGWRCYITDLIKCDYDVGTFKRKNPVEQRRIALAWSEVLQSEISAGKPALLVPMGKDVRELLPLFVANLRTCPSIYDRQVWHYATFNYGGGASESVYDGQFASLHQAIVGGGGCISPA